jgi:hypothetical protein
MTQKWSPGCSQTHYRAQASFELMVFLPQPPKCSDYSCVPPHLAQTVLLIQYPTRSPSWFPHALSFLSSTGRTITHPESFKHTSGFAHGFWWLFSQPCGFPLLFGQILAQLKVIGDPGVNPVCSPSALRFFSDSLSSLASRTVISAQPIEAAVFFRSLTLQQGPDTTLWANWWVQCLILSKPLLLMVRTELPYSCPS